jgi:hypothetical protein
VGAKLIAHLRDCRGHRRHVELGAAQLFAVGDKILRHPVRQRAEHQVHRALKERPVGPHRARRADAFISLWKQRWFRKAPLQFAKDALGIAIDVGADLHHRGAPITSRHRHQIRPRHDSGDQDRCPFDVFQAEHKPHLLGEWRRFEMMQDDGGGGRHGSCSSLALREA